MTYPTPAELLAHTATHRTTITDGERKAVSAALRSAAAAGADVVGISAPSYRDAHYDPAAWCSLLAEELRAAGYTVEAPSFYHPQPTRAYTLKVSWAAA